MAHRYDSRTTTFDPEGRLFQVEYALQAINNAAAAVGVLSEHGVIIAAEKKISSSLLAPPKTSEKMYKLDDHVCCAVAGLTSDANTLIRNARVFAQQHKYTYDEDIPVEQLVVNMCNYKQSYTQHGGLRPFGVSFLYAGWDKHRGFQLYVSDPSGNYSGWKATAIGQNFQSAQSALKSDYKEDLSWEDSLKLSIKTLVRAMDTASPSAKKIEIQVLQRIDGRVVQRVLSDADVTTLIESVQAAAASSGDA